jgi:ELP3 family radical SAM enzyme/protein acetyltransferase
MKDIEDLNNDKFIDSLHEVTEAIFNEFMNNKDISFNTLINSVKRTNNKWRKLNTTKVSLLESYLKLVSNSELIKDKNFTDFLIRKPSKGESGIFSISLLTSPYPKWKDKNGKERVQRFSCKWNCYYCPNEIVDGKMMMPRSYLSKEPACQRASKNDFDPIKQIYDRLHQLSRMGHNLDKIELIVLGGTVLEYPREYLTYFTTECFYICNIYPFYNSRPMLSLEEEQKINETANIKIIGYTLETRPDGINHESIYFLRSLGVTRMQIGIQHTNNRLLKIVNRGHTVEDSMNAIKLLKDSGIKIISHLMPDLPYATKEDDMEMFKQILENPNLQCDEYKIYPTVTTEFTKIKEWADRGEYIPNADKDPNYLKDVIGYFLKNVKPWVRVPRVIRDIPNNYIYYGNKVGNLREEIEKEVNSKEIRSREIRNIKLDRAPKLLIDKFLSSGRIEYFIRYETHDEKNILGFCRLRLNDSDNPFLEELYNSAIIRELHVYGKTTVVNSKNKNNVQHLGLGKQLVKEAEWIALKNGYIDMCITSGIGVREYYKNKLGYNLDGMYMKKNILLPKLFNLFIILLNLILIYLIYIYYE